MKLATYEHGGQSQIGVVSHDTIVPVHSVLGPGADMISLIEEWDTLRSDVEVLVQRRRNAHALSEVRLQAPIRRPGKIMCIGLNYQDHIEESGLPKPECQVWFCKTVNTVNGPFDTIPLPSVSGDLDYEAELVAVIGRRGKHISRADAPKHVFGFCVGNDVSIRDWQLRTTQFTIGKSFDGHAPFGPWITTSDAVDDPHKLGIRCYVNGELRQNSSTSKLVFSIWEMIEHLSQAMTLEAGDLIFTGTPGGVGWGMQPRQMLKIGDRVRCELDGLSEIENVIASELR